MGRRGRVREGLRQLQALGDEGANSHNAAGGAPAAGDSDDEPVRCEPSTIQRSAGEVAFFKVRASL